MSGIIASRTLFVIIPGSGIEIACLDDTEYFFPAGRSSGHIWKASTKPLRNKGEGVQTSSQYIKYIVN